MARFVSNWTGRPVVNRAGLSGLYQFQTEHWGPNLESAKAPIDTYVIERVGRPTAN